LSLHTAHLDARAVAAGTLSERDAAQYLAWNNSLSRALAALGLKAAAQQPQSLADLLADISRNAPVAPASTPATGFDAPDGAPDADAADEPLAGLRDATE
jgi:hypothetical protein